MRERSTCAHPRLDPVLDRVRPPGADGASSELRHHDRGRRADDRASREHRRADEARRRGRRPPRSTMPAGSTDEKIKILIKDDACNPKQAVTVANLIIGRQIQVCRRARLLGIVDPCLQRLCRERRPDDEPGVLEPGAHRKGSSDDHAPLSARRPAGRVHRSLDRREIPKARRSPSCTISRLTGKAWLRS